jgi:ABC-type multidrug transport system fused ATPase/permease subunit
MSVEDVPCEKAALKKRFGAEHANCFSRLFFLWVNSLVNLSGRQVVEDADLAEIPPSSKVQSLTTEFDTYWSPQNTASRELERGRHLFKVGKCLFARRYAWAAFLMGLQNVANCATPFLLKAFVDWFVDRSRPTWEGWVFGGSMLLVQAVGNQICANHAILSLYVIGMDCRSLVNALVYRKALRLNQKARSQTTAGQVVSLMASDSERLPMALLGLNSLWMSPITVLYGLTALIWLIGWAGLVAVVIMILTFPLPMKIGAYQAKVMQVQMTQTDTRVKTVNEGLQGIRVLKYYAWDKPFGERVQDSRIQEIVSLRRQAWAQALNQAIMMTLPLVMALGMIATYYALDPDNFTPANAFTALSLLNLIRMPLAMLPMGIKGWVDLKSTTTRLQRYLLLDEHDLPDLDSGSAISKDTGGLVAVKSATFQWEVGAPVELSAKGKGKGKGKSKGKGRDQGEKQDKGNEQTESKGQTSEPEQNSGTSDVKAADTEQAAFALTNVSVLGEAGQLCAIVGKVGSGKSSLLNAMLSEMPKRSGDVVVNGSIAYCSQVPWIQNATLRDNILFGSPMDEKRYDDVIHMCALGPDCIALPGGDLTEIGEKGVTLSGGQKARVALARACYRQADVYLLDDVLSAVDSETGSWLFERCIKALLARNCLVILATNAVNFLEQAHAVWVLNAGAVSEQGSYDQLRALNGGALNELLSLYATKKEEKTETATSGIGENSVVTSAPLAQMKTAWSVSDAKTRLAGNEKKGELTAKEARAEGSVSWKVWYFYFVTCSGGICLPLVALLCALAGQASKNIFEWWLSHWTSQSVENDDADHHLPVYVVLGLGACVLQLLRALVLAELILRNARRLRELLLRGVMRAPMSFFDTTSMGRVINRFSKDMDSMDTRLQQCLPTFVMLSTDILGLALTIGINMPFFFLPLVPLLIFYWDVSRRFRPLNRDLQRLESASRSPLFAQFSETLQGTSTIRAYGDGKRFLDQSIQRIDVSNRAFFTIHNANRWLQLRLELVGSLLLATVIAFALEGRSSGNVSSGLVALSMFYAANATQVLNFAIRMFAETEARMTSTERIHEYAMQVDPEAPDLLDQRPPADWPSKGRIELCNVSMRYRPNLPLVLNDVTLAIEGGSKVGICGRTGSGKSTLFSVLFRIVDIYPTGNQCKGCIKIDGLDMGGFGLRDVRRALAIIPQDPVMFAGSVRDNIDLFRECSDEQLWEALRHASLENVIKQSSGGLEALVQEGGENFSCGERQLVCLARALLRQSKIICLDEATANIDVKTDATIQEVIKTEFADRTVLTIAHRLNTIATHDRILVLDAGRVAEYGSPAELLALGDAGKFKALVQELGESAAAALEREVLGESISSGLLSGTMVEV